METCKFDRTKAFFYVVFILYLWDVAYFLGVRIVSQIPHPLSLFSMLGDVEFLRGFTSMLREIIFSVGSGGLIGMGLGALILYSPRLTEAGVRLLRLTLWLPLLLVFAGVAPVILAMFAAMLCACYYYIAARSLLALKRRDAWNHAAREAVLHALLIALVSQAWMPHWQWLNFVVQQKPWNGLGVFATIVALIGIINWCCRFSFNDNASRRAAVQINSLRAQPADRIYEIILAVALCLGAWQLLGPAVLNVLKSTDREVLVAAVHLLIGGEIWVDMGVSLLEVGLGIAIGSCAALGGVAFLPPAAARLVLPLLPLTYISALVLWQFSFYWPGASVPGFLYLWHKVVAVSGLAFFSLWQSFWAFRERPLSVRILLAIDDAIPIAFVAMIFGEMYAATQGLGFSMIVATATGQTAKALAVSFITFALIVGLSVGIRGAIRSLYLSAAASRRLEVHDASTEGIA